MSDERSAIDPATVQRALNIARLATSNRRSLTTLSVHDAINLARVALALATVAEHAATLLQVLEEDACIGNDAEGAAHDEKLLSAQQGLASVLLVLGFVHIMETHDGQEG
ncbi:Uncharacterised protein [Starkeya nomas]|uniref:Uncharacterized protein n=1 Tax=Starkeya nomas TaxID=2666134 RepID=A0A5S9NB38_9HYPH|nr:hypothetical protein [Starkeya nomas]CAA0087001.1 Uncharacterised protein [Starkeya nomas]